MANAPPGNNRVNPTIGSAGIRGRVNPGLPGGVQDVAGEAGQGISRARRRA